MIYSATIQVLVEADSIDEAQKDLEDLSEQLIDSNRNNIVHAKTKDVRRKLTDEERQWFGIK